jgi:hypothetical protein
MIDLLIFAGANFIFLIVGYLMGKGILEQKVKEIIKARDRIGTTGAVKPLEPRELDKKRSREILDKYQ